MIFDQKETTLINALEAIPYLYSKKYKSVINILPENEKNIITEWFSKAGYISEQSNNTKDPLPPGFATSDFKIEFDSSIYNDLEKLISINKNIVKKYNISRENLFNIQINYIKELYKSLEGDFNVLHDDFYKNKEKTYLTFGDLAFIDKISLAHVLEEIDFPELMSVIRIEKEAVKAQFVKSLFEKTENDKMKIQMIIEDLNFIKQDRNINIYDFANTAGKIILSLSPFVKSGKIIIPENKIFPSEEYINEKLAKIKKINDEKTNYLEITDILYIDLRSTARLIRKEEIEDENFYALLYLYKNTELSEKLNVLFTEDFKQNTKIYFNHFDKLPHDEVKNKIDIIKKVLEKMSDNNEITLYSQGLWLTYKNNIVYLDKDRHVKKYDFTVF